MAITLRNKICAGILTPIALAGSIYGGTKIKADLDLIINHVRDNPTIVYDTLRNGFSYKTHELKKGNLTIDVSPYSTVFKKKGKNTFIACDHGNDGIVDRITYIDGKLDEGNELFAVAECDSKESLEEDLEGNELFKKLEKTPYNSRKVADVKNKTIYDFSKNKFFDMSNQDLDSAKKLYGKFISLSKKKLNL